MFGNYNNKLDDKGRLTIPSKLREELGTEVVISFGFEKVLEVRTKKEFEIWSQSLLDKGNLSKNARDLQRAILGHSFELSIDKAGRVNVPDSLIALSKLSKEVTLIGVGNKLEIHSADNWANFADDGDALSNLMEDLANKLEEE